MTIFETDYSIRTDTHHSTLSQLGQNILMRLAELQTRRKLRRSFTKLPEKVLRDISLTRHDIRASCSLPLSHSAADALCKIAKTRAVNW